MASTLNINFFPLIFNVLSIHYIESSKIEYFWYPSPISNSPGILLFNKTACTSATTQLSHCLYSQEQSKRTAPTSKHFIAHPPRSSCSNWQTGSHAPRESTIVRMTRVPVLARPLLLKDLRASLLCWVCLSTVKWRLSDKHVPCKWKIIQRR